MTHLLPISLIASVAVALGGCGSPTVTASPGGPSPDGTVDPTHEAPPPVAVAAAVDVSRLPAEPIPSDKAAAHDEPDDKPAARPLAEDTSTAAISIVEVRKH